MLPYRFSCRKLLFLQKVASKEIVLSDRAQGLDEFAEKRLVCSPLAFVSSFPLMNWAVWLNVK